MTGRRDHIWERPAALLRLAALGVVVFHALAFGLWSPGADALIYYGADLSDPSPGHIFADTFTYSPAAAWWIQPLQALPFQVFRLLVVAVNMAGLVILIGPTFAAIVLLAQVLPIWLEFQQANVNFAVGAALVLGFARPGWYALPLLTKVTPGVGLVWFAVRREWRQLAMAVGITLLVALPSLVLHADAWFAFIRSLLVNAQVDAEIGAPILLRGALAVAVIAWGARTNRAWTVPVGAALVAHVNSYGWLVVLGVVRLLATRQRASAPGSAEADPRSAAGVTSSSSPNMR
jgi:hypothetical protein